MNERDKESKNGWRTGFDGACKASKKGEYHGGCMNV